MKRVLTIIVAVALLFAGGQSFASDVTDIQLRYADGSAVAAINIDGAVRFTHQTEEAKDGRPFRVIVDILSATHRLGANNFTSLPDCPIKGIRTSQYSVKPEAIVRVVFDMASEQVYRVESSGQTITLYFADKMGRSFAPWSTSAMAGAKKKAASKPVAATVQKKTEPVKVAATAPVGEKSAQELNQSIKKDRMASLEAKPKPKDKKAVAKVSKGDNQYGPFASVATAEKKASEVKSPQKKAAAPAPPAVKKKAVEVASNDPVPPSKPAAKPTPAPVKTKKSEPAKAEQKPAAQKPVVSKTDKVEKSEPDKRSTSRFRRAPVTSKKIKGTLVAEFPKRLVIKYKAKRYRDPFATLIDESKTYDDPIERQVPNVEGLKLVGVIQAGAKDNRALFEDSEGYGYILRTGDKVQKGYVLRVEADRVYFQIFEYGWSRTVALHLES